MYMYMCVCDQLICVSFSRFCYEFATIYIIHILIIQKKELNVFI